MSAPDFEKMAREIETRILNMEIAEVFRVRFGIEAVLRSAYDAGAQDEREKCAQEYRALNELAARVGKHFARGGGNG